MPPHFFWMLRSGDNNILSIAIIIIIIIPFMHTYTLFNLLSHVYQALLVYVYIHIYSYISSLTMWHKFIRVREREREMGKEGGIGVSLFETREARFRGVYKVFASTIMAGICLIWYYRLTNIPSSSSSAQGRWAWIGMFMAEVGFGLYWIITQSVRWSLIRFHPFKEKLSQRYTYFNIFYKVFINSLLLSFSFSPPIYSSYVVYLFLSYTVSYYYFCL